MVSQELQLLYARSRDLPDARRRLHRALDRCARAEVPELTRLGRTLDAWREELLAFWTPTGRRGVSNELQAYGLPRRGPVFTMADNRGGRTSRPITPARVSAACGIYLADAGTGATLHALRHFFATALYQTSQDLRLVQEALGHSSPNITAIYAAFDTSKTAGAMARVAATIEEEVV